MLIKEISARKIKDSRSEYTIEVSINGCKSSSPSGKSTGKYETPCYHKSLDWNLKSINNFKELKEIEINSFEDLKKVESLIKKKFKLKKVNSFGANALFALESAILKALAKNSKKELWEVVNNKSKKIPVPVGNIIGGGLHSHNEDHPVFQEFLIIPQLKSAKRNFHLMQMIHKELGFIFKTKKVNDEGAWQTDADEISILTVLSRLKNIKIGLDVAANSFYCEKKYEYKNKILDRNSQIFFMNNLIKDFNILYLEDPLQEEDFSGFSKINKKNLIVGDDLTVTHIERVKRAIKNNSINAMIVKPNQNGSLIQVKEICDFCKKNKIKIIVSHRSGETMDSALADFAVAFGADYIKCGISTKWRESKLKRLIEIENKIK